MVYLIELEVELNHKTRFWLSVSEGDRDWVGSGWAVIILQYTSQ